MAFRSARPSPAALLAVLVGLAHAALLVGIALHVGYDVGPTDYSPLGVLWRYGGLALVAAIPAYLLARVRLLLPAALLVVVTGFVLQGELTPPLPTFEDYHGFTVVENGLYVVSYARGWYAWAETFALAGLVEYAARSYWRLLPAPRQVGRRLPLDRHGALVAGSALGVVHAAVWSLYAVEVQVSNLGPLAFAWIGAGMFLLGGTVGFLLLGGRVVAPAALFVLDLVLNLRADFYAWPDGPVPLYVGAWFFFLAIFLLVAAVELGLREAGRRLRETAA